MKEIKSLISRGKSGKFCYTETGEIVEPKFLNYHCAEDYEADDLHFIDPMCAKEEENLDKVDAMLEPNSGHFAEEKFDGVRAILHLLPKANRVFSRTVSVKTNWHCENTDLVPHIRDLPVPKEFYGTILDGEFIIPDRPFKDVSSTMNCLWDKAIDRQIELGFVVLKAFDIVYYKGVNVKKLPLWKRKELLHKVVKALNSPYVIEIQYSDTYISVPIKNLFKDIKAPLVAAKFPALCSEVKSASPSQTTIELSKKAYYEYIVFYGGEGLILKDINGKYCDDYRGKEYTKLKKFDTWDVVIVGFTEPTREYDGKKGEEELELWPYWEDKKGNKVLSPKPKDIKRLGLVPVTKPHFKGWIGAVEYGIVVTKEEIAQWEKKNKKKAPVYYIQVPTQEFKLDPSKKSNIVPKTYTILRIGDASGMNDEMREEFSKNKDRYIGTVIEIKGHEVIKKTCAIRHPRFLRTRPDKGVDKCTWKNHLRL